MKPGKDRRRRRLCSPTESFRGIITRSRAENFLHRSRSGRARPDPVRRGSIYSGDNIRISKSFQESRVNGLQVCEDTSLSYIKDLRARRIFSPAAVPSESFEDVKQKIGVDPPVADPRLSRAGEIGLDGAFSEDDNRGSANSEWVEALPRDIEVFSEVVDEKPFYLGSDGTIPDFMKSEILMNGDSCGEQGFQTTPPDADLCKSEPEEVVHNVDMGETPPDTDIWKSEPEDVVHNVDMGETPPDTDLCKSDPEEVVHNVDMGESCLHASSEKEAVSPLVIDSKISSMRGESASTNKEHRYDCGKRLQLIPCPRRKLFRNPNSLSYRRLLPYLMGVSPNSAFHLSGHSENISCENQSPVKVHKHTEGNLQLCLGYVAQENGATSEKMSCLEHLSRNPETSVTENFAENEPIAQLSNAVGLEGSGEKPGTSFPGKHVVNELETIPPHNHCNRSSLAVNQLPSTHSDDHVSKICTRSPSTPHKNLQIVAIQDHQELSIHAPTKGILKTTPQKCRGFCSCLSCSHFRLHAEKSYDFCRKQMQDTERIVMGLLKEMAHLRSVMEKRLDPTVQGASDSSLHLIQDMKICKRIHRAEDLARTRLRQMAQNANIHCKIMRLQRPRVAFADQVEKLIFKG